MSRELDARVAREVMGWEIHEAIPNALDTPIIFDFDDEDTLRVAREYNDGFVSEPWSPSTDMNAAMEVARRVELSGWGYFKLKHDTEYSRWAASFENYDNIIRKFADTPALTICLAALQAVKS